MTGSRHAKVEINVGSSTTVDNVIAVHSHRQTNRQATTPSYYSIVIVITLMIASIPNT